MKHKLVLLPMLHTDSSPTKAFMKELGERDCFGRPSFGKRAPVDLFDLAEAADCVHHPANHDMQASKAVALREKRFTELNQPNDPRVLGSGEVFDYDDSTKADATEQPRAK